MTYLYISEHSLYNLPYHVRAGDKMATLDIVDRVLQIDDWLERHFKSLSPYRLINGSEGWRWKFQHWQLLTQAHEALTITDPTIALAFKLRWF